MPTPLGLYTRMFQEYTRHRRQTSIEFSEAIQLLIDATADGVSDTRKLISESQMLVDEYEFRAMFNKMQHCDRPTTKHRSEKLVEKPRSRKQSKDSQSTKLIRKHHPREAKKDPQSGEQCLEIRVKRPKSGELFETVAATEGRIRYIEAPAAKKSAPLLRYVKSEHRREPSEAFCSKQELSRTRPRLRNKKQKYDLLNTSQLTSLEPSKRAPLPAQLDSDSKALLPFGLKEVKGNFFHAHFQKRIADEISALPGYLAKSPYRQLIRLYMCPTIHFSINWSAFEPDYVWSASEDQMQSCVLAGQYKHVLQLRNDYQMKDRAKKSTIWSFQNFYYQQRVCVKNHLKKFHKNTGKLHIAKWLLTSAAFNHPQHAGLQRIRTSLQEISLLAMELMHTLRDYEHLLIASSLRVQYPRLSSYLLADLRVRQRNNREFDKLNLALKKARVLIKVHNNNAGFAYGTAAHVQWVLARSAKFRFTRTVNSLTNINAYPELWPAFSIFETIHLLSVRMLKILLELSGYVKDIHYTSGKPRSASWTFRMELFVKTKIQCAALAILNHELRELNQSLYVLSAYRSIETGYVVSAELIVKGRELFASQRTISKTTLSHKPLKHPLRLPHLKAKNSALVKDIVARRSNRPSYDSTIRKAEANSWVLRKYFRDVQSRVPAPSSRTIRFASNSKELVDVEKKETPEIAQCDPSSASISMVLADVKEREEKHLRSRKKNLGAKARKREEREKMVKEHEPAQHVVLSAVNSRAPLEVEKKREKPEIVQCDPSSAIVSMDPADIKERERKRIRNRKGYLLLKWAKARTREERERMTREHEPAQPVVSSAVNSRAPLEVEKKRVSPEISERDPSPTVSSKGPSDTKKGEKNGEKENPKSVQCDPSSAKDSSDTGKRRSKRRKPELAQRVLSFAVIPSEPSDMEKRKRKKLELVQRIRSSAANVRHPWTIGKRSKALENRQNRSSAVISRHSFHILSATGY